MKDVFRGLVNKITVCRTDKEAIDVCIRRLETEGHLTVSFANAHAFNMSCKKPEFYGALSASSVLFRDGIGVKILFKLLKKEPGANLNGTDLIPQLLEGAFKGKRIAIFGSTDNELSTAAEQVTKLGLDVVCTCDGFRESKAYLALIDSYAPEVVLLAMGMPKQELVSQQVAASFEGIACINGGAIVDFMAGKVERAPEWIRKLSLEWLYRLCKEPKRLFKRYVVGNVTFLTRAIVARF
ncbi:glycosyltransferase [Corallincola luteus]|uniref:Glycosyltransferase n=1 Tax=Corallincola luteus TaxID=1775177 RepID=A0ABY2AIQ3_9GAMM|nr:WecB/TagA/CpsF family glycosyltransferase [Corallincola luteus]TCI02610.1 glycosyltransferase [Corallincola luteus]